MTQDADFAPLEAFLIQIPAITGQIGKDMTVEGGWWVKFSIDIDHVMAWNVVQEFGHVLNYLSIEERLPTAFMPVSPPPYLNGGPRSYLAWIIECHDPAFKPGLCAEWLSGRLPRPVGDLSQWTAPE